MFRWLNQVLGRARCLPLPLEFEVEEDDTGRHQVRIYTSVGGARDQITDRAIFSGYGYTLARDVDGVRTIYKLAGKDTQTLLALKSLNPEIKEDGSLTTDILPPQLRCLRQKPNVREGPRSKAIEVLSHPEQPCLGVTVKGDEGLEIVFGYQNESGRVQPADRILETVDGPYARVGRRFVPLPPDLRERDIELLTTGRFSVSHERIPRFFLRDLVLYQSRFSAVLADDAAAIRVIDDPSAVQPIIELDASVPGWLDFDVSYDVHGERVPAELLHRDTDGNGYYQVGQNTWVVVDRARLSDVDSRLAALEPERTDTGHYRIPAYRFASLQDFVEDIGGDQVVTEAYHAFLDQLTGFSANPNFPLSSAAEYQLDQLGIRLYPHQREGIHWLDWLGRHQLHGLLADDMGLGKTIQAIEVLRLAYERTDSGRPSLVIAPRSVLLHWEREIKRCYPEIRVFRYHGTSRSPEALYTSARAIFVTTYSTAANDIQELSRVPFFYVVLDEVTFIKNPSAKRTNAAKQLNAAHRLALSGTPIENRPAELWSIFDFLMPGHLGRHGTFVRIFEDEILAGDAQSVERLGRRIHPFMLRRLKTEVAKDLPAKIPIRVSCELTSEQRQLYGWYQDSIKRARAELASDGPVNTMNILTVLTKLKQICDHPALVVDKQKPIGGRSEKFDLVAETIREIVASGDQVVVFSQFLHMLDLLESVLGKSHINYIRIDGSTRNRQELIDRFGQDAIPVALCSLRAANMGINLQTANHVIHADRWWNPATEDQATDRVHRIGQSKTVYVHYILIEGTLEERIDALIEKKREVAAQIIEAAGQGLQGWTREELLEILKPLDE